jgi:hypothetical protein
MLELRNNYGSVTFDPSTKLIVYPLNVPASRLPSSIRRVKAGAARIEDDDD